jgi:hypothetical protein
MTTKLIDRKESEERETETEKQNEKKRKKKKEEKVNKRKVCFVSFVLEIDISNSV